LQFDIVDRLIEEKTNPGETVYDPFGGIMTVPFRAIKLGRKAYACELSETYFKDGIAYCRAAEESLNAPSFFDDLELEAGQYLEPDHVAGELIKTKPSLPSEKKVHFERLFVDARNGKNGGLQTETLSL
jgi:tRNA G37 N-methylase Trm5